MSREQTLRERLLAGPTRYGLSMVSMSPAAVEVAGLCGLDFVWLELEHAATDMMQMEHLCRAAELRGMLTLLRVQEVSRTAVLRALEVGGKIIVVPQVHTPEDAAAAVEWGKFAPIGSRGFNTGSRGLAYGFSGSTTTEILENANRDTCVLVQIESAQAVQNAEAIIATEGLDGILLGPGDLSASMGIAGQWENEKLLSDIEGVFALARKYRKVIATVCPSNVMTRRLKAAGAHLLNVGGDLGMMKTALLSRVDEIRTL